MWDGQNGAPESEGMEGTGRGGGQALGVADVTEGDGAWLQAAEEFQRRIVEEVD